MAREALDLSQFDSVDAIGTDDLDAGDAFNEVEEQEEEDTSDADNENEDQDEGPIGFSFGEDEPEQEEEAAEPPSKLRGIISNQDREIKRLKAMLEPKVEPIEVGPRPRLEDFDFDHDAFDAAVDTWLETKQKADNQHAALRREQEEKNREGNKILTDYQGRAKTFAATHRISDYEDAQSAVEDELGVEKVSLLIAGSPKAEELIYALHKNPAKLKALAGINNLPRFMYEAATLQKDIKVRQGRKSPPVDAPVRSNGSSASGDRRLAALEAEAARTGDRSKVVKYKADLRDKH